MRFLFNFCLGLILLSSIINAANAEDVSIDELLSPESPTTSEKDFIFDKERLTQKSKQEISMLDDLLGPEQIFPFLPDNHRDSGTGKFNAF